MGGRSTPTQGSSPPPKEAQLPVSTGWFELHQGLFNALPKGVVELGRSFSGFEERADGMHACSCMIAPKDGPQTPQLNWLGSVQLCMNIPEVPGSHHGLAGMHGPARRGSACQAAQHQRPAA